MSSNTEALQVLASETKKLVQDLLGSASFDVTRKGKITEVLDNNKYSVNIDGTVYTVPSCVTIGFAVNDTVLVISCQNDAKKNYIIGKSNAIKGESDSITADMLKSVYDVNGNGIVDNAERVNGFTIEKNVPSDAVFTDTIYTHPSTHSADIITDGTTNKVYTATEKSKLSGVATGATVNDTDINLKNRANHTGTQTASTISDFSSAALSAAPAETVSSIGSLVYGATAKTSPIDTDAVPIMDSADSNKIKKFSWAYVKSVLSTYFGSIFAAISHTHTTSQITDMPTSLPANGGNAATVNNHTVNKDVPSDALFTDTTYVDATASVHGLMSSADKTKLDGIAAGAEKNVNADFNATSGDAQILNLPSTFPPSVHTHTLSGITDITATAKELNTLDGITASATELNYTDGVTSNIQTQLNSKAPIASPAFTGVPTAPTAASGTNTAQIATTAFVQNVFVQNRVTNRGYTGGSYWYYPLTTLPIDDAGNYCSLKIDGRVGGWVTDNISNFLILLSNRGNYTGNTVKSAISGIGAITSALSIFDLMVYKQTDLSAIVYIRVNSYFCYDFLWTVYQATNLYNGTYSTTTPSGTLIWQLSTAPMLTVDMGGVMKTTGGFNGNSATATKLVTARNIALTGDVSGSVAFDGTSDASITATVADDSHNHVISNVDGLQTALDGKVDDSQVLTNVPANAVFTDTVYTHPASHPPSIIVQDASNRFVTDTEKTTWNGKEPAITKNTAFNVNFDTIATNIKMDGTRSLGSLSTVARADHVHPTDTSRAASSHTHAESNITNLTTDLAAKAPLASPALTGTPTAPTATAGTNTAQLATTEFVQSAVGAAGGGDMMQSVFDADSDGIIDRAETADKLTTTRTINGVNFDGTANITVADSTKLPLAGGAITGAVTTSSTITASSIANIKGSVPTNTVITPDTAQIIQAPIAPFLWHDIFAFNKVVTPTFETSTDGSTYTAGTLDSNLFSQKENQAITVLNYATQKAVRWTWHSSSFGWSSGQWLIIAFTYVATAANKTILFESSADGTTWTTRHTSTGSWNAQPVWFYVTGYNGDGYLRLTITWNSGNGNVTLSSVRLLTVRWGDQGQGRELSFPYDWDANRNITMPSNLTVNGTIAGNLSGNAALIGTPTAPTASSDTNTTQIATTAFVQSAVSSKVVVITSSSQPSSQSSGDLWFAEI